MTEREPVFLKDKGDAFFKAGDYRSALEAHARAADAERAAPHPDGVLIKILANRAACLLRAGHHDAAAEDCAEALAMLHAESTDEDKGAVWPPDKQRAMRFKLLVRRAARAPAPAHAAAAARTASAAPLAPDDDARAKIDADLEEARACLVPLDAVAARERGDARPAGDVRAPRRVRRRVGHAFRSGEDATVSAAAGAPRRSSPTARRATCPCPTTAPRTTIARRGWTRCWQVRRSTQTPRARASGDELRAKPRRRRGRAARSPSSCTAAPPPPRTCAGSRTPRWITKRVRARDGCGEREALERDAETVRAAGEVTAECKIPPSLFVFCLS